ncbi:hypothetical protein [Cellvibrio fibrivorans]|uniref:Uncharacterized protein n=1 Tax=Cellvibrio fibrivorans TaxID=126350 RepID=A0ABU1UVN7_9GAMM|nr:hypothetical protein [Cellvibrio fibrivorans]MDR7089236.1 hypothetical protein [Cellvibrio fibrivorans]
MKLYERSRLFVGLMIVSALTACGGDDNKKSTASGGSAAPTHSGNISKVYSEKDAFEFVELLSGAVDTDGDILLVRNLTADIADTTGFESAGVRIGVRPSALAPHLDTGDVRTVTYTYNISDGVNNVQRTATFSVMGEDAAPEFENIVLTSAEDAADVVSVDLLQNVIDADEEPLSITDVKVISNPDSAATLVGSVVTINVGSFKDSIKGGDIRVFSYEYKVNDHNHSLPRTAIITINGVSTEPEPPTVYGPQKATFTTAGTKVNLDLIAAPNVVDWNGDAISVDYNTLKPVGDAPAFKFSGSANGKLVIEPAAFYQHVADTKTFIYSYDVVDSTGRKATATAELTVTRAPTISRIANGGFESGLVGWVAEKGGIASVKTTSALGLDFKGAQLASFSGADTITANLTGLEVGATYIVENRVKHADGWGSAATSAIFGTVAGVPGTRITGNSMYEHGGGARTNAVAFTGGQGMTYAFTANQATELDDVSVYKYGFEQANNLISENDSTFESGVGNWKLGAGAMVSANSPISGAMSLESGKAGDIRNILPLATGAIKNGKRYLVTMDVEIVGFESASHTFRVSVVDPTNFDATVIGGAFKGVYWLSEAKQTFAAVLDVARDSTVTDWATRAQELHVGTNVWGQGFNYRIDNVRLFEIQ